MIQNYRMSCRGHENKSHCSLRDALK